LPPVSCPTITHTHDYLGKALHALENNGDELGERHTERVVVELVLCEEVDVVHGSNGLEQVVAVEMGRGRGQRRHEHLDDELLQLRRDRVGLVVLARRVVRRAHDVDDLVDHQHRQLVLVVVRVIGVGRDGHLGRLEAEVERGPSGRDQLRRLVPGLACCVHVSAIESAIANEFLIQST